MISELPSKTRRLRDRIAYWNPPNGEDIVKLRCLEKAGREMLDVILLNCPDNSERQKAIEKWEELISWGEKSIKRRRHIE